MATDFDEMERARTSRTPKRAGGSAAPLYPVGSVGKALELLGLFGDRGRGVRVGEASEALGIAPSTVHRMFAMFQRYGYVRQHAPTKVYYPGQALLELAESLVAEPSVGNAALPELERLVERTKETAYLSILEGDSVHLVACVESPLPLKAGSEVGKEFQARSSASGRAMLAQLPADDLRKRYGPPRQPLTAELAVVRRRGYAVRVRQADGIHAVARAIALPADHAPAAVVLAVPSYRVEAKLELLVRELRRSTARLSTLLPQRPE